nr:hypothetical protein [Marivita hallyeonensis]
MHHPVLRRQRTGTPKQTPGAEEDEPDLDQKRTEVERAHKADEHKQRRDDLAGGIGRPVPAGAPRLNQGESTDIDDRAQNTAGLKKVWIGPHVVKDA